MNTSVKLLQKITVNKHAKFLLVQFIFHVSATAYHKEKDFQIREFGEPQFSNSEKNGKKL